MASDLLPVEEALQRILAALVPLPAELVPVSQALGRVTAEPIRARRTQPPVAVSAMDGYAVRATDVATVPVTRAAVPEVDVAGGRVVVDPTQILTTEAGRKAKDGDAPS